MNLLASVMLFAAEGGEEVFEAHDPLLPETKEIIFGGSAFLIVAFFLVKFAGPAIKAGLKARSDRVQRDLDNAAKAEADAQDQAADIRAKLGDIDAERARLLADADDTAGRVLTEGRSRLDQEAAELQSKAEADIAGSGSRMASEIEGQVGRMAGDAAEQLVASQLDDATAQRLVEEFIAKVGSSS